MRIRTLLIIMQTSFRLLSSDTQYVTNSKLVRGERKTTNCTRWVVFDQLLQQGFLPQVVVSIWFRLLFAIAGKIRLVYRYFGWVLKPMPYFLCKFYFEKITVTSNGKTEIDPIFADKEGWGETFFLDYVWKKNVCTYLLCRQASFHSLHYEINYELHI